MNRSRVFSCSVSSVMENPTLPQEILYEIFLLLPVKSVGKCRCLSKTWRTLLCSKHFKNSHLKFNQQGKLILVDNEQSNSLQMVTLPFEANQELPTEIPLGNNMHILGTCNGLVLLQQKEIERMFVCNPVTLQQVDIPIHSSPVLTNYINRIYGFGYDSSCDDYKVVRLAAHYNINFERRPAFVDVYSLKNSVWKRVAVYDHNVNHDISNMTFVNGAVHWITMDSSWKNQIHAFDLANETFHQVPLPTWACHRLVVLKGCLGFITRIEDVSSRLSVRNTFVWVMKEYGVVDSWVRFRFDDELHYIVPIYFVGDEKLLCVGSGGYEDWWTVCALKEGILRKTVEGENPFSVVSSSYSVFVESLVFPELGDVDNS